MMGKSFMTTRQIALAAMLLALVFLAHLSGRFFTIGVAQLAPSIAIYVFMALLLAVDLSWGALAGIALAVGILTMIATGSPFPPANIPAHGLGFVTAAGLTRALSRDGQPLGLSRILTIVTITLVFSWTLFSSISWLGLTSFGAINFLGLSGNAGVLSRSFEVPAMGLAFGQGLIAWWTFGFLFIAIPTWIIAAILTPILYRAVRPVLIRQGMIEGRLAPHAH